MLYHDGKTLKFKVRYSRHILRKRLQPWAKYQHLRHTDPGIEHMNFVPQTRSQGSVPNLFPIGPGTLIYNKNLFLFIYWIVAGIGTIVLAGDSGIRWSIPPPTSQPRLKNYANIPLHISIPSFAPPFKWRSHNSLPAWVRINIVHNQADWFVGVMNHEIIKVILVGDSYIWWPDNPVYKKFKYLDEFKLKLPFPAVRPAAAAGEFGWTPRMCQTRSIAPVYWQNLILAPNNSGSQ